MTQLRAIIVGDEKPARRRLRELLENQPDIAGVKECVNGAEAVRQIRAWRPDLLFLDIKMPGLDGFGVINKIVAAHMPATVFVTAPGARVVLCAHAATGRIESACSYVVGTSANLSDCGYAGLSDRQAGPARAVRPRGRN